MGDYRKLDVYNAACAFSDRIVTLSARLPKRLAGVADQLGRASDSIHEAIAEGCGFNSDRQLAKYLKTALSSGQECEDELQALYRRGELEDLEVSLLKEVRSLCAMTAAFKLKVESDIAKAERRKRKRRKRPPKN